MPPIGGAVCFDDTLLCQWRGARTAVRWTPQTSEYVARHRQVLDQIVTLLIGLSRANWTLDRYRLGGA